MIDLSAFSYLTKSILCFFFAIGIILWNRRDVRRWKQEGDGYLSSWEMARNFKDWALALILVFASLIYLSKY